MGSLDKSRILDDTAWELREGVAEGGDTLCLHLESTLLRHGGVPDVVCSADKCIDENIAQGREAIHSRVMRGHIDHRIDIRLLKQRFSKRTKLKENMCIRRVHRRNSRR